jgi:hypothetical protein
VAGTDGGQAGDGTDDAVSNAGEPVPGWDFFISYTSADRQWAEWMAWELEQAGYGVLIQAWDFVAGSNWAVRMQDGIARAERTIAVLSGAYLRSVYGQVEWQAAQAADPLGFTRKLVPIRVDDCHRPGLLGQIVSFDLFGLAVQAARHRLLDQIAILLAGRAKPPCSPTFPGAQCAPLAPPASATPPFPAAAAPAPQDRTEHQGRTEQQGCLLPRAELRHRGWISHAGHHSGLLAVTFSADGCLLATGSEDRTVMVWNIVEPASPRRRASLTGHRGWVLAATFSPDSRQLVTSSADNTVVLWNLTDPDQPVREVTAVKHDGAVRTVKFSPDGQWLATGSADKTAGLWMVADQDRGTTLADHRGTVWAVAFSPDGRLLATGSADNTVALWDVATPTGASRRARLVVARRGVRAVAFSPDGSLLAAGGIDGSTVLLDVTGPVLRPVATLNARQGSVRAVAFSPDSRWLAIGQGLTVGVWEVSDPANPTLRAARTDHRGPVRAVAFSPDGRWLATCGDDGIAIMWELA